MPRSRISIARVTMKALSRNLTMRNPLASPTTAPMANTITIAGSTPMPKPEPPKV
jgi:hypothetical protein